MPTINTNVRPPSSYQNETRQQSAFSRLSTGVRYVGAQDTITPGGIALPLFFYVRDFPSSILGSDTATSGGEGTITAVVVTVTSDYSVPDADYTVQVNPSVSTMNVTLPTAAGRDAGTIVVKDIQGINSNGRTVSIVAYGSETIDGSSTFNLGSDNDQAVTLRSDGSTWRII